MPDAQWSVTVPTRHTDDEGTGVIVGVFTDAGSDLVVTTMLKVTASGGVSLMVDGLRPEPFEAWSST